MSKKKVLLRGVFINRDTNGEGVLKVGTTLIRVSTVMGILYIKLGIQEGMKQGIQQGMQQGRCLEVYSLVQDGILDPEVGASRVSMSLDDFADAMQKAGYKLPEMV